jgi:hypothetical protein
MLKEEKVSDTLFSQPALVFFIILTNQGDNFKCMNVELHNFKLNKVGFK